LDGEDRPCERTPRCVTAWGSLSALWSSWASVFALYTARSVLILILVAAFLARETAETTAPLGMP
jgi:hypothetical protein